MQQKGSGFLRQNVAGLLAAGLLFTTWMAGAAPVIRSGAEPDYPPLSFVNENGAASGFSVELLRETLRAMGREVSFETAPWAELKQKLATGELDVLPLVGRTPEREALYDFTIPYLTLHGALFVHQNETAIHSVADLLGKTIAVMKGDNAEEYVLRENLSDQVVSTATFEEAFQMLSRGEVDAVIAQKLMGVTLLKKTGIPNVRVTGQPNDEFKQDFCFAVPKGNQALLSVLNEGLALTIQDGTQQRLKQKWLGTPFYDTALARPLVYGGDRAFPPYEYLDENGEPAGFNIEIARALARELGVEISFRMEPRSEIRREMDAGEIDLAAMFYSKSRDRTADFSTPITASEQAVFSGRNSPLYTGLDSLRGKKIAVQNGDISKEYLLESGFARELVVTQSTQEALRRLADGEIDFSLSTLLQGRYWIQKNGWKCIEQVDRSLFTTDYCFAVPEGQTALLSRINEGLLLLKQSREYQHIYNQWLGVLGSGMEWEQLRRLLLIIGSALALTAAAALWFFLLLRRQVRKKTADLQVANQELDEAKNEALNRMQEALQAREKLELTQFALDSSSDTVFWIAPNGHFTFVNQAACDRLGYSRDELLSMSIPDINPDFPPDRWPQQWQVIKENRSMRFESHHKTKDGRIFPVEIYGSFIEQDGQKYIFAFVHDITARVQHQKEQEQANRELQSARKAALNTMEEAILAKEKLELTQFALDSSSDTVFWIAPDGHFTFVNQAACEQLGYSHDELLSMSVPDIDPDVPAERWPQQWQAMQENRSMRFESHHKTKDGRIFPIEIYASLISRAEKDYIFAFVHDITARVQHQKEQKQANRELQSARKAALNMMQDAVQAREETAKSEKNLRITLNSIGDAVISTDIDGRVVSMNPIAESLTGWTEAEATGEPLDKVFRIANEQTGQPVESPVDNVLKTGHIVGLSNHTLLIAKNGRETPIADSGAPIQNADGETTGVVLVFRDQTNERAARRALEDSEARLQRAQKIARVGDWEFSPNTGCVNTSDSAREIYGLPDGELRIDDVKKFPLVEYRPMLDAALKDLIESGRPYDVEFTIRRPSDQALVEIHSIAEYDPETETVFGVIQDITERKKAELALVESREYLKRMWDNMAVGIALIDAETQHIIQINPALQKMSGYTEEELKGKMCHESICPACKDHCPLKDLGEKIEHSERTLIHKDGHTVHIEKTANVLSISGRDVYLETMIDISERRKAEAQLRRLSTAIEQSPETVVITDTEGIIQYVNPAFGNTTGYTAAEAIGRNPRILKSGKQSEAFYAAMWNTLKAGGIWTGRIVNKRKDGTLYTENASIAPVKDQNGLITNYVGVKRDISAELAQEEKMQEAQKMEAVGQLAGGIAHDFNNILQAILGFSEILLMQVDESDENPQKNIQEIQKAAEHAADLTKQLLSFSRKQDVIFERQELNQIVQDSESFVNSVLGETVALKILLNPEPIPVCVDSQQIERSILNMAINARDAMPKGGTITLQAASVEFSTEDAAVLPNAQPGHFACLSVADTGVGMPEETIEHIFEPFFTTKEPGKGTGLGLSAIYGIIQDHKGWINVYSEPGKGTTFKIYLPLHEASDPAKSTATQPRPIEIKGHGERILVVEDDPSIRELSDKALRAAGYQVECVSSAEDALQRIKKTGREFSLVISDVILPKKNGAEMAAELKKKTPDLPVILCSGYSGERVGKAGISHDDFFFLEKPFSITDLLRLVDTALKGAS